ncbi:MAG: hypothetical protein HY744_20970 [Deltaproteobacteria bacterium]|nr:hypothetical protein [Deltaproteobacteria bacterium]
MTQIARLLPVVAALFVGGCAAQGVGARGDGATPPQGYAAWYAARQQAAAAPVQAGCPAQEPVPASMVDLVPCAEPGLSCTYVDRFGCPQSYTCRDDGLLSGWWGGRVHGSSLPASGSACFVPGAACQYAADGGPGRQAVCTAGGTWSIDAG